MPTIDEERVFSSTMQASYCEFIEERDGLLIELWLFEAELTESIGSDAKRIT